MELRRFFRAPLLLVAVAVLLLDVSPASFGPVEATTRLAAYLLASTLLQHQLPAWLVTMVSPLRNIFR